jgi:lysozyme
VGDIKGKIMHPQSISEEGVGLIKRFEGLHKVGKDGKIRAYRCPAGKWTCGWGSTKGVRSGTTWTEAEAEERLRQDIKEHEAIVKQYVQVPLTQGQYDALVSFVYNLGGGNFRSSTLLKKLNQGLYDEVPEQLMRWNKARVDGKLTALKGLTRRRAAESAIFSADAKFPSDEGGPVSPQKVEAAATKPLSKSKTMAGAGIAGAATALGEITPQIEALVPYSESMKTLFLLCAIGGIALAAYSRFKDHKEGIH